MRFYNLLILLFIPLFIYGQTDSFDRKKFMKEVKETVKMKNYSKVTDLIKKAAATYPEVDSDAELHNIWMNANYNLALAENTKIYLAKNPDTLKYMDYIYKMYECGLKCDSIECQPNAKGKVKHKYRKNVAEKLSFYRKNFENAGKFFYNKRDYVKAYSYIDRYISTLDAYNEIMSDKSDDYQKESRTDRNILDMSVLAVLAAYATADYNSVIKYLPLALNDNDKREYILEIATKAYLQTGNQEGYMKSLDTGFWEYPKNEYFFASLLKHCNERNDFDTAMAYIRRVVELCPQNHTYWYIKGKEERLLNMPDSAIVSFTRAVELKIDEAEAYSSLADIYIMKAQQLDATIKSPSADPQYEEKKRLLTDYYQKACTCYEKAREYDSENTDLWLLGLKEAYFKLNKGKELQNLERLR